MFEITAWTTKRYQLINKDNRVYISIKAYKFIIGFSFN